MFVLLTHHCCRSHYNRISPHQGYYDTMDAGFVDEEGFLYIMSRSDDVINVAGHRLSAGALEEVGERLRRSVNPNSSIVASSHVCVLCSR